MSLTLRDDWKPLHHFRTMSRDLHEINVHFVTMHGTFTQYFRRYVCWVHREMSCLNTVRSCVASVSVHNFFPFEN